MRDNLSRAMDSARSKQTIKVSSLDLAVNNPDGVREKLGSTFQYDERVEAETVRDVKAIKETMRLLDPEVDEYVTDVWQPQEYGHALAIGAVLNELDLAPVEKYLEVDAKFRALGRVAAVSEQLHEILYLVYSAKGAIHEKATAKSYSKQMHILSSLGENALVETVFKPIAVQEGPHFKVYHEMVKSAKEDMKPWQLWTADQLLARTFSPVGTSVAPDVTKPHFGEVVMAISGDKSIDEVMKPVAAFASDLIIKGSDILPKSIINSSRDCVEAAKSHKSEQAKQNKRQRWFLPGKPV